MNLHLRARLAAVISVVGLACFVSAHGAIQTPESHLRRNAKSFLHSGNTGDFEPILNYCRLSGSAFVLNGDVSPTAGTCQHEHRMRSATR
jgi:hypothetical protein